MSFIIKGKIYSIAKEYLFISIIVLFLGVAGVLLPYLYGGIDNAKATTFSTPTFMSENAPGDSDLVNIKKINNIYYLTYKPSADQLKMATSSDMSNWSAFSNLVTGVSKSYDFGYYNNGGYFYLVFSNDSYTEIIFTTSSDAVTWSATSTILADINTDGQPIYLSAPAVNNFLTLGYAFFDGVESTAFLFATSSDGVTWTTSTVASNVLSPLGLVSDGNNLHALYDVFSDANYNTSSEVYLEYAKSTNGGATWTTTTIGRTDYQFYFPNKMSTLELDNDGNPGIVYYKVDEISDFVWDEVDSSWGGDGNVTTSIVYAKYSGSAWASSTIVTFPLAIASTSFGLDIRPSLTFAENNEALFAGSANNFYPYLITNTNTLDISQVAITQIDDKAMDGISGGAGASGLGLVFDTSTLSIGFAFVGADPVTPTTDWDLFFTTSTAVVVPSAPTGLSATPSTSTQIDLTWNSVSGATSYILYRSTDNFSTTSTVTTTALTSYSDTGLTGSTQYYYKVLALNEIGNGSASSAVNTTTLAPYDGNLPALPAGSVQKLVYTNDIYYLTFASSTGGLWDIYITTSTNGVLGTWSEPVVISPENIKIDNDGAVMLFDFVYNTTANDFGLAYTATSSNTYFVTSTDSVTWSAQVTIDDSFGGYISFDYFGNSVLFVQKQNMSGIHSAKSIYSTNGGSSWTTSTVFSRDVSGAGDPSSAILGAQIGDNGSLHMLYSSAGDGGAVPHQLIYASSTDNGVIWTDTTVGTEIGDDSLGLEWGTLGLDSNDDPGVLYAEVNDFDGSDVTTTIRLAKRSTLGVWTTSTIYYPASATGISGFPKYPKLEFVGSDYPLAFHFGNNYNPVWSVSTTTDPYVFTNNTLNADVIGDSTSLGLVYVTSTEIVAMTYIDNAGQLFFVTSSLSLPVGSAPTAPSGLSTVVATSSITLSWTDNSDDEDGFVIQQSTNGVDYSTLTTVSANTTSSIISSLLPNTHYWEKVAAYNSFGTSTYTASNDDYTNPVVPGTPSVSNVSTSSLTLTWDENLNASNTEYYILYSDANFSTTTATTTDITGLTPNTEYTFTVRAQYLSSSTLYTAYSASSTATTTNPNIPGTPSASANGQTSMIVAWSANSNPAGTLYQLYNYTTDVAVGTTTSTSYTTTGLTAGTSYQFKVKAQYQSDDTTYTSYSDVSTVVSTAAIASTVSMNLGLAESATFKLSASGDTHTATVNSVVEGVSANLTIASTPVTQDFTLNQATNLTSLGITVTITEVGSNYAVFTLATYTAPSSGGGGGGVITLTKPTLTSFTINSGAKTTNSRIVTLNIKAHGVALMVLSNSSDFDSYSYESYVENKTWTLTPSNGTKTVYIRLRSASGGEMLINQSIVVDDKSTDTNAQIVSPSTQTPSTLSPSTYTFTQFLTYGMRSNEVKQLQIRLQELGYLSKSITPVINFGPSTRAAVIKLQKDHNLQPPVGYVGPGTRTVLNAYTTSDTPTTITPVIPHDTTPTKTSTPTYTFTQFLTYGMRSNEVKQLQIRLQELGYLSKSITPVINFGPSTRAAVIKLQKDHNLQPPVGYVGPGTRTVLNQ